eukprot:TRINITY_DN102282_c0_g1_i1.p1 TRINITY_DN102282_c0_g1~~TRINITY_DN102282_c0_g1_i1.p1  ORF type:complete len:454 (+),score=101.62 TRINITY_DN102282_c0_g1_i1:78-1439(+)
MTNMSATSVPPRLTLARARALMVDLLNGFSTKSFQQKLEKLVSAQGHSALFHVPGRKELALSVQDSVLPRYGFEGSEAGVAEMVRALQPLLATDSGLAELSKTIREKLRMSGEANNRKEESENSDEELLNGKKRIKLESAIALQNALLASYSGPEFQMKLRKLMRKDEDPKTLMQNRKKLILEVQVAVLPKYGFSASEAGVQEMKEAFEEWKSNSDVQNMNRAIEEQLVACISNAIAERDGYSQCKAATDKCSRAGLRPRAATDGAMARQISSSTAMPTLLRERAESATASMPRQISGNAAIVGLPRQVSVCSATSDVMRQVSVSTTASDLTDVRCEPISKAETLELLQELLQGFSSDDFQWKLALLKQGQARTGFGLDGLEEIALKVQKKVLPRHGFRGTRRGVAAMVDECSRYAHDSEVADLRNKINDKLGMDAVARQRFWKRLGKSAPRA